MRKRRLAILVAFCIAFLTLFMQTYAASSAPTKSEIYTAYYDFLRQRIDDVGILEPSTVTGSEFAIPERSGVYYAQLLDFDQDGTDELFVIESKQGESISAGYDVLETWNLCWSIYSYSGNSIQFLGEGEFLGSGRAPFGFCTALDGTQYFFFFSNFLDSYSGEYYTVINGNLEKKYSLYVAFNYDLSVSGTVNGEDVWVHSDTMHSSLYQVNNEWVDYSTFMEKRNQLRANNVIEYGFLNNRVPDGATQQVINQLTQQIPESYLSGYYSPSSWAKSGVIQAIGKGFVPNNLQRKYNQPITRAEFCALAVKYYETIKPFVDPKFQNNVILTGTEFLTMNTRPKIPANARNLNACVIGSSGSGKTRFWLTPQLLQAHSSYVVVDPKGGTLDQCGRFLQREKYKVRVFNSIDFSKSMHYNPLAYIKTESDVLKFVTALIANTKGDGKEGDEFWTKAETLLYCALVAYIVFEGPEEERNMNTLVEMINSMEVREDDETFKNAVDYMFDGLERRSPQHFAVRQYKKYKLASGDVCSK